MAQGWHKADIKAAVEKRGLTLTRVAIEAGLATAACRNALRRCHVKGEKAISTAIDVPLWDLWPDRWGLSEDGVTLIRKTQRGRHRNTNTEESKRLVTNRHGQKSRAA